ncbi:DctP family TRAP transporter solute-binding subunit [Sedimentibacter sp.]|uniref:DctP family TRAP transporter solute-binding subunit n=1 Tax=Sedimentibacter sp. TaxID=1960295 RepID=UPI002899192F|nr:DctP family TRAP transporter solute-binding subunit [Sedimentibacter sp.]
MKKNRKERILAFILVMIMTVVSITGCSNQPDGDSKEKIKLTAVVAGLPENSPSGEALREFAKLVNEYSDGTIEIDCFYGSELGNITAAVESMVQGTIDIMSSGTSYFSGYVPEIQVFELPYIFGTNEEARKTLDSEIGDEIKELFTDKGIVMLSYWESGLRHVTNSRQPIKTPEDMKGIKIRTVVSTTQQKTWESFGAIPMAIDMNETFTAMQQGTVDAQENTLAQIVTAKLYEVQKYLSLTGHAYTPMPFGISKITWDKLNDMQKDAIQRAANEARDLQRSLDDISDVENINVLKEFGIEVEENPNREEFGKLVQPVYDLFISNTGSDYYLKAVQDYVKSLR